MKPFLLLLLLSAGCSAVQGELPDPTPPRTVHGVPAGAKQATVVHVTDGDTIVLQGIHVGEVHRATGGRKTRLIGIDTPEVHGSQDCFGQEASTFTKRALDGRKVFVDFDVDPIDRYGRALVYLWEADGTFFNERIASEGFAQQATFPPNVRYVELFRGAVREAREQNRGLWSRCR